MNVEATTISSKATNMGIVYSHFATKVTTETTNSVRKMKIVTNDFESPYER